MMAHAETNLSVYQQMEGKETNVIYTGGISLIRKEVWSLDTRDEPCKHDAGHYGRHRRTNIVWLSSHEDNSQTYTDTGRKNREVPYNVSVWEHEKFPEEDTRAGYTVMGTQTVSKSLWKWKWKSSLFCCKKVFEIYVKFLTTTFMFTDTPLST